MTLDFQQIIKQHYQAISLDEMKAVSLLNRKDTKYLFTINQLEQILVELSANYKVLRIDDHEIFDYDNTYFDTQDYDCFKEHHRGKLNRIKIRTRSYSSIKERFFEIKTKTNKNRTEKLRKVFFESDLNKEAQWQIFLHEHTGLHFEDFINEVQVRYKRITLVSKQLNERCTLDFDLTARINNKTHSFNNLCVAELKQDAYSMHNPFASAMKSHHIYPEKFSKYCFSLIALKPELKHHLFKINLRQLNKLLYA